jgi:hypothetical protein
MFSSLRRDKELEGQKCKKLLNISKNGFYKQILDFHRPSKILGAKMAGPYCGVLTSSSHVFIQSLLLHCIFKNLSDAEYYVILIN